MTCTVHCPLHASHTLHRKHSACPLSNLQLDFYRAPHHPPSPGETHSPHLSMHRRGPLAVGAPATPALPCSLQRYELAAPLNRGGLLPTRACNLPHVPILQRYCRRTCLCGMDCAVHHSRRGQGRNSA